MRRAAIAVLAAVAGTGAGVTAATALRDDTAVTVPPVVSAPTTAVPTVPVPTEGVLLAWVPGGLPVGFGELLAEDPAFVAATVVRGDIVQIQESRDARTAPVDAPGGGRTIPVDAIALDCGTWSAVAPLDDASALCGLEDDEALLGATSAELRGVGAGATITLAGGRTLRVAGIVDDAAVGAAELVVPIAGAAAAGITTERYALAVFEGDRAAAEARLQAMSDVPLRVRGPGETPWLRHGDAVLPQSLVKAVFGEFAAEPAGGGRLDLDPAWVAAHIVTVDLPLLGATQCHRAIVPALTAALAEIERRGLVGQLDRGVAGCWNPRTIAGSEQPSRHAFGVAFDLIPLPDDPSDVDAVVAVMERWGFAWGGRWVVPDPEHFEYVRRVGPPPARG